MAEIYDLLPPETIERLVAAGLLSPRIAKKARAEQEAAAIQFRLIERAIERAAREKGAALSERELRVLMEDFPGRPTRGTSVRKDRGRWKQQTRLPHAPGDE